MSRISVPDSDPTYAGCDECIHADDEAELCVLRKCIHACSDLKECYKTANAGRAIKCVDLSERVTATFFDEELGEWTARTVTIEDVLDRVCDEYTVLPSAQSEQRWILCSERVPEEDEQVLVYLYDSPYIAWIDSNGEWNTEEFTLDKEKEREDEPIAWMPLPDPYKAERREE